MPGSTIPSGAAARDGAAWRYTPEAQALNLGYALWIEATDETGNGPGTGPFDLSITGTAAVPVMTAVGALFPVTLTAVIGNTGRRLRPACRWPSTMNRFHREGQSRRRRQNRFVRRGQRAGGHPSDEARGPAPPRSRGSNGLPSQRGDCNDYPIDDHKAEAKEFLEWMTTPEFGALLGSQLPGFFPMHQDVPDLENQQANTFLSLNRGRDTDVRFALEKLREGSPDGDTLMMNGAVAVINGEQTPEQAADALQAGLAQWFEPAQTCDQK